MKSFADSGKDRTKHDLVSLVTCMVTCARTSSAKKALERPGILTKLNCETLQKNERLEGSNLYFSSCRKKNLRRLTSSKRF